MALKVSNRADISPFIVMDVMRAANRREATGKDVLHLEVGQPDTAAVEEYDPKEPFPDDLLPSEEDATVSIARSLAQVNR